MFKLDGHGRCHQQRDLGERGRDREGDEVGRREGESICLGLPLLKLLCFVICARITSATKLSYKFEMNLLLIFSWQPLTLLYSAAFVQLPAGPSIGVEEIREDRPVWSFGAGAKSTRAAPH